MKSKTITLLSLLSLVVLAQADEYFDIDQVFHQQNYNSAPMGFWTDANGIYAANYEGNSGSANRSRWTKVAVNSPSGNLNTAETAPQMDNVRVWGVNRSGLCCGWAKIDAMTFGPCTWNAGSFATNITAVPVPPISQSRQSGEALMVNNAGWVVGYFSTAQSAPSQDPFVKEPSIPTTLLPLPFGFPNGRATCIACAFAPMPL